MMRLIDSLEERHPNVRAVMAAALANVVPTHLLDRSLVASALADGTGPTTLRAEASPRTSSGTAPSAAERSPRHRATALPVRTGARRLPLIPG
jgi:hypothetical protein